MSHRPREESVKESMYQMTHTILWRMKTEKKMLECDFSKAIGTEDKLPGLRSEW